MVAKRSLHWLFWFVLTTYYSIRRERIMLNYSEMENNQIAWNTKITEWVYTTQTVLNITTSIQIFEKRFNAQVTTDQEIVSWETWQTESFVNPFNLSGLILHYQIKEIKTWVSNFQAKHELIYSGTVQRVTLSKLSKFHVKFIENTIHVQYCQLHSIGKDRSSIRPICSIWRIGKFLDDPTSRVSIASH